MKKYLHFLHTIIIISLISVMLVQCKPDDTPKQFPPPTTCPGAESVEWGEETYPTVQIGEQCWLAKNLNIGLQISSEKESTNNDTIEKYCYNDDPDVCEIFGGLYQRDELLNYFDEEGAQGICPPGWHVPTSDDIKNLYLYVEGYPGYLLKNDPSWGGLLSALESECPNCVEATGFNLLPSGEFIFLEDGAFHDLGDVARFWTSSYPSVYMDNDDFGTTGSKSQKYACLSVRCIKN